MIPQKSGEVKKVCTSRVSNLGSFQDPISSSLEENPQNTPRCPENVKNTAEHPAWMDFIDIMHFTYSLSHLNTIRWLKRRVLALTIHRHLSRGPGQARLMDRDIQRSMPDTVQKCNIDTYQIIKLQNFSRLFSQWLKAFIC